MNGLLVIRPIPTQCACCGGVMDQESRSFDSNVTIPKLVERGYMKVWCVNHRCEQHMRVGRLPLLALELIEDEG